MKILVIGGTKFIGTELVRRLVELGHDVTIANRGKSNGAPPESVRLVCADRDRLTDRRSAFEEIAPDVVVHNVISTEHHATQLLDAFRGIAGRVVMVSSMDVYRAFGCLLGLENGVPSDEIVAEDGALRERWYPYRGDAKGPEDPRYQYDKIPAERAVMQCGDLPGTVLRLPMVIGPRDYQHRLFPFIKPMLDGRPHIVMQDGFAQWKFTYGYVENVAAAMALACTDERAVGGIYNVADGAITMLEAARCVQAQLAWDGRFACVPKEALPTTLQAPFDVRHHLVCSTDRIRSEFGFEAPVGREEAFRRTVAWERDHSPDPVPEGMFDYAAEDAVIASLEVQGSTDSSSANTD